MKTQYVTFEQLIDVAPGELHVSAYGDAKAHGEGLKALRGAIRDAKRHTAKLERLHARIKAEGLGAAPERKHAPIDTNLGQKTAEAWAAAIKQPLEQNIFRQYAALRRG